VADDAKHHRLRDPGDGEYSRRDFLLMASPSSARSDS
jgi:hypothetical protein